MWKIKRDCRFKKVATTYGVIVVIEPSSGVRSAGTDSIAAECPYPFCVHARLVDKGVLKGCGKSEQDIPKDERNIALPVLVV